MKTSLDISCELSAWQTIQIVCLADDSHKISGKIKKNKNFRMSSATNFAWGFKGLFIFCTGTAPLASELHPTLVGKAGDTEIHVCYISSEYACFLP